MAKQCLLLGKQQLITLSTLTCDYVVLPMMKKNSCAANVAIYCALHCDVTIIYDVSCA